MWVSAPMSPAIRSMFTSAPSEGPDFAKREAFTPTMDLLCRQFGSPDVCVQRPRWPTLRTRQSLPAPEVPARRRWVAALQLALVGAAIGALIRECRIVDSPSFIQQLHSYDARHIGIGLAATAGSFLTLGLVELVAVRVWARIASVEAATVFSTSFVANALSQSIGISLLTGGAVRARAYARSQVDTGAIARITAFVTVTATLGLIAAGGVALLAAPANLLAGRISIATRPAGLILLAIAAAYLAWSAFGRSARIGRGSWHIDRPSLPIAMSQVALSVADWMLAAIVLNAFMPHGDGMGFLAVASAYVLAQLLAVTSHVPAGAGVFELSMMALLGRDAAASTRGGIAAALVMFRLTYYLLPLVAAIVVALLAEFHFRRIPAVRHTVASHAG